ncbi:hypothetical protein WJX73_006378 [Symbiochloris irregularis]|uniref:AB hydrolase-1 domain-containing protein n=1 Tax=Symbiochloris irregularis TaxID=706552 RepID=A0AAW1P3D5_9CHLO
MLASLWTVAVSGLLLGIAGVRQAAFLAGVVTAPSAVEITTRRLQTLAAVWLAAELGYYAYSRWRQVSSLVSVSCQRAMLSHPRYTVLSSGLPDDACMDRARAQVIMDRLYNMDSTYTIQDFFSGWFMGADPDTIGHDNLLDFTAYGFFGEDAPMLPSTAPLFFMHGVGLGLTPYVHFIYKLMTSCRGRDMVLVECRHVSLSMCLRAVSPDVVCKAIVEILHRNNWTKAAFVGHSYGSFVLSRMAQLHKNRVESMVLIDPVCMFTVWPSLLQNFIYKLPVIRDRGVLGLIDGARYLFSRDLVIAHSFCRKFVWHKVMLWPEEMPDVCLLVLSAADDLVPSPLVQKHLLNVGSTCQVGP